MNQPPLNPDALTKAKDAFDDAMGIGRDDNKELWYFQAPVKYLNIGVEPAIRAYLAAALPEVTSVEELEKLPIMTVAMFAIPPLERRMPFELCTINREDKIWMQPGDGAGYRNDMMARYLPATVIYLPEVKP